MNAHLATPNDFVFRAADRMRIDGCTHAIAREGMSFLIAEQNINVALRHASHAYILENGRVVMDGSADELRSNEDVKEFYLGLSGEGRKSFREIKHYRRRKRWLS